MTSSPGKQTVALHVLPDILWSKGNHAMKFGHLIENMSYICLEKSYTKCSKGTLPRLFPKKSKLSISQCQ